MSFDRETGEFVKTNKAPLFLKGPIPIWWLNKASSLPGKALNVALAIWWLHGMSKGGGIKLTGKALGFFNVSRYAVRSALDGMERLNLIRAIRRPGRRPEITVLKEAGEKT
jgi:hypothetical protein